MAFTLWNLFEASILILNAVCVLHEERFLAKIGWGINRQNMQGFGEEPSVKLQVLNLVRAIRTVARCKYVIMSVRKQVVSFQDYQKLTGDSNIIWYRFKEKTISLAKTLHRFLSSFLFAVKFVVMYV